MLCWRPYNVQNTGTERKNDKLIKIFRHCTDLATFIQDFQKHILIINHCSQMPCIKIITEPNTDET